MYVDDQPKAIEFWTKQVGFVIHREQPMGPHASWTEVGPPHAESCLVLYPKSKDWAERKPSIVFECENIHSTFDAMRAHGVQFTQDPKTMPWGSFAMFLDSEGNSFCLRDAS